MMQKQVKFCFFSQFKIASQLQLRSYFMFAGRDNLCLALHRQANSLKSIAYLRVCSYFNWPGIAGVSYLSNRPGPEVHSDPSPGLEFIIWSPGCATGSGKASWPK